MTSHLIQRSAGNFMAAVSTLLIIPRVDGLAQPGNQAAHLGRKTTQPLSRHA